MPAILVDKLGKRYRLGARQEKYRTLRDTLAGLWRRRGGAGKPSWFWALDDVSFSVEPGEVLGIIGRNGAGKLTLLKILSRITEPTVGRAELFGRVGSLLEVGTGFHPELTGRENLQLSAAILGMRRAEVEKKLDTIVEFAGVERFIDTPVKHYSSGMYLRLAFSVAAHLEPEILLVDEVLAVGDVEFQKRCLGRMGEVAREGRTVFFVSHNMAAIERLCARAIHLHEGKILADGPAHAVVQEYLQSGTIQAGERVWAEPARAPGDEIVRLKSVRALDAGGRVVSEVTCRDPLHIEIEFWVLEGGHELTCAVSLTNEQGTNLFQAGDFQAPEWRGKPRPPGVYRCRCAIPGDLLNEGSFTVLVALTTMPVTVHFIERDAISVRVIDRMEPGGARGYYSRPWPGGALRPLLSWTTEHTP